MSGARWVLLAAGLLAGCVLDRTGRSATSEIHRQLADHGERLAALEASGAALDRRLAQVEEVVRGLGRDQLDRLETMEALQQEVAALRGALEELRHDYDGVKEGSAGFQTTAGSQLAAMEARLEQIEQKFGIRPPAGASGTAGGSGAAGGSGTAPPEGGGKKPEPLPSDPEEVFERIMENMEDSPAVSRALAQQFMAENPKSDRVSEAQYRLAQSYQKEGSYKEAASAYQVVVDRWPDSAFAPWAMLRQGECFASLGRKDAAKIFWEDLIKKYPKSKAAKEAKALLGK